MDKSCLNLIQALYRRSALFRQRWRRRVRLLRHCRRRSCRCHCVRRRWGQQIHRASSSSSQRHIRQGSLDLWQEGKLSTSSSSSTSGERIGSEGDAGAGCIAADGGVISFGWQGWWRRVAVAINSVADGISRTSDAFGEGGGGEAVRSVHHRGCERSRCSSSSSSVVAVRVTVVEASVARRSG